MIKKPTFEEFVTAIKELGISDDEVGKSANKFAYRTFILTSWRVVEQIVKNREEGNNASHRQM